MGVYDIEFISKKNTNFEKVPPEIANTVREGMNIHSLLQSVKDGKFREHSIHEFLENCEMKYITPSPPPRDPELEKRVQKLRAQQQNAEYREMTKSLSPQKNENLSIGKEITSVSAQITAVVNFVLTVGGSFFFAYKALEYALPTPNVPAQALLGVITSTVVAAADLFFLARTI